MAGKIMSLTEAAALVQDGDLLALGGNALTRIPAAFVRELARQGREGLRLVKTAGAYDVDLLCAAEAVAQTQTGYVGFENLFGLAPSYRRSVEEGRVQVVEHACSTVIAGLRASAYGLPSQPTAGLGGSDVAAHSGFRQARDPYTGALVYMVPRIRPRFAVLHATYADAEGNARIDGGVFEDVLMSRAAEAVILTAERIEETAFFVEKPDRTAVPAFMVQAVVHTPGGARPGGCHPFYDIDEGAVGAYLDSASRSESLRAHLDSWEASDYAGSAAASGGRRMSVALASSVSEEVCATADKMAVFLSRFIRDGELVFHGVASPLPMAAIVMAQKTHAPNLTYLNIPGGVDPRPSYLPGSTVARQLMEGALSYFNLMEIFDLSARGKLDLAFLGGAQIDEHGDMNLSFIGDPAAPKVRLPGGAGSAHILPTARRTVLWRTVHDARSFPARCDFVTASGNVEGVVTPLCIFEKVGGRLQVKSIHQGVTPEALRAATGFDLGDMENAPTTPEPTAAERAALDAADPEGVRLREFI